MDTYSPPPPFPPLGTYSPGGLPAVPGCPLSIVGAALAESAGTLGRVASGRHAGSGRLRAARRPGSQRELGWITTRQASAGLGRHPTQPASQSEARPSSMAEWLRWSLRCGPTGALHHRIWHCRPGRPKGTAEWRQGPSRSEPGSGTVRAGLRTQEDTTPGHGTGRQVNDD